VGYSVLLLTLYLNGFAGWERSRIVRSVCAVGRGSYNIFLWNFFLWQLPIPFYQQAQGWVATHAPSDAVQVVGHFVVFSFFSILVGASLTELVETPFLKLRDIVAGGGAKPPIPAPGR